MDFSFELSFFGFLHFFKQLLKNEFLVCNRSSEDAVLKGTNLKQGKTHRTVKGVTQLELRISHTHKAFTYETINYVLEVNYLDIIFSFLIFFALNVTSICENFNGRYLPSKIKK
jgi:hypothetical protein